MKNKFWLCMLTVSLFLTTGAQAQKDSVVLSPSLIPGSAKVFFVIGDFGHNGEQGQKNVADAMKKAAHMMHPDFVVTTGDNFYCCGVASKDDPQWMNSFENIYSGDDLQIDWYGVLGNHDYMGNPQSEIDYATKSRKWVMPARYYDELIPIDKNRKLLLLMLDTSPFLAKYHHRQGAYADVDSQDTAKQMHWADSVLSNVPENTIKIAFGHHPVLSDSWEPGDTQMQKDFAPLFEKHHVQTYICGHVHNLQHHRKKNSKVEYFISGGGAAEGSPYVNNEHTLFAADTSGFLIVAINGDQIKFLFVNSRLKVIYTYVSKV